MLGALWKTCANRPVVAGARGLAGAQMHRMIGQMSSSAGLGSCRSPVPATLVPRTVAQSLHQAGGAPLLSVSACYRCNRGFEEHCPALTRVTPRGARSAKDCTCLQAEADQGCVYAVSCTLFQQQVRPECSFSRVNPLPLQKVRA